MPRNAFQWWTVHFGMSDVFQRFLAHLDPLNQNPSDAALPPLSILQNSRWRPRWPPSEWKLLKWPYCLCYSTQKCTFCVYLYVLPPKEYDGMGFNFYFRLEQIQHGGWPPSWKISNGHISGTGRPIDFMFDPRVGFSGRADRMDLLPVAPNPRGGRTPSLKISNDQSRGGVLGRGAAIPSPSAMGPGAL